MTKKCVEKLSLAYFFAFGFYERVIFYDLIHLKFVLYEKIFSNKSTVTLKNLMHTKCGDLLRATGDAGGSVR